jgi:hypothetical protein
MVPGAVFVACVRPGAVIQAEPGSITIVLDSSRIGVCQP